MTCIPLVMNCSPVTGPCCCVVTDYSGNFGWHSEYPEGEMACCDVM